MKPHLAFSVENKLSEDPNAGNIKVDLHFKNMDDFEPENVARQVKPLKELLDLRTRLSDLRGSLQGNDKLEELLLDSVSNKDKLEKLKRGDGKREGSNELMHKRRRRRSKRSSRWLRSSLLDQIVEEGRLAKDPASRERGKNLVKEFVAQVLEGSMTVSHDAEAMINARIAQIDHLVSIQLNEIMHHPAFQKLEGTWRGLKYLMDQSETGAMLKIKVLNVCKKELLSDLQRAPEFDQSALFKKVYEEEYGIFGGDPVRRAGGRLRIRQASGGHRAAGKDLQRGRRGARAVPHRRPLRTCSTCDSFTSIDAPRDLAKIFDTTEYAKWKSFRAERGFPLRGALPAPHPDAPALRQGRSHGGSFQLRGGRRRHATTTSTCGAMRPGALASRLTNAFAHYGWCAAIRGVEGGGLVEGLPTHNFTTDEGDIALKCPTESPITDRREKELADLGFVPLVHCKDTDYAAFFSVQSAQKPKLYDKDAANANARLSTQLPYILAVSRFAHYLKAMMRDKIGSFMSRKRMRKLPEPMDSASTSWAMTTWRRKSRRGDRFATRGSR